MYHFWPFQYTLSKEKNYKQLIIGYRVNGAGWKVKKGLELDTKTALDYVYQWSKFRGLRIHNSEDIRNRS